MMAFVKSLNSGLKPVIVNLTNRFRVTVRLSLRVSRRLRRTGGRLHVGYVRLFSSRSQTTSNLWSEKKIWKIGDHYFSTFFCALLLRNRLMAKFVV